jgi:hypothetical protein
MLVFLGSVIIAGFVTAGAARASETAGFAVIVFPFVASLIWLPAGVASIVVAIIAVVRRERRRRWTIALIIWNAVWLVFIWEFRADWIFWVGQILRTIAGD